MKLSLEWLYQFEFLAAACESNRLYIPRAYSIIVPLTPSFSILWRQPADPSFPISRPQIETARTSSEHYSRTPRYITFPARPTPSYALHMSELWLHSLLDPAVTNCLGSQFPIKWDSWLTIKFFLLEDEDLSLDYLLCLQTTWNLWTKPSDASCFSALLKVIPLEMNVTVLHLLIRRLPAGHLEVPWLHSH